MLRPEQSCYFQKGCKSLVHHSIFESSSEFSKDSSLPTWTLLCPHLLAPFRSALQFRQPSLLNEFWSRKAASFQLSRFSSWWIVLALAMVHFCWSDFTSWTSLQSSTAAAACFGLNSFSPFATFQFWIGSQQKWWDGSPWYPYGERTANISEFEREDTFHHQTETNLAFLAKIVKISQPAAF